MDSKLQAILNKLFRTRRGETVCLMAWEVDVLLEYIAELQRKDKEK